MSLLTRRRELMVSNSQKLYFLRGNTYLPTLSGKDWLIKYSVPTGVSAAVYTNQSTSYIRLYATGKAGSNDYSVFYPTEALFTPRAALNAGFTKICCKFDFSARASGPYYFRVSLGLDTRRGWASFPFYFYVTSRDTAGDVAENVYSEIPLSSLEPDSEYYLCAGFRERTVNIENNIYLKELYLQ